MLPARLKGKNYIVVLIRDMMKRLAVVLIVLMLTGEMGWAARAKVENLARDPYVSALVVDAASGKALFSENPDSPVYPASVIKLMNLLVVLERIEQGQNRLDEMVQVTAEAAKTGGSQVYLDPKERFSLEDLLYALAVQSANDAAVALAVHIAGSKEGFVELMNQKAAALGMKNTRIHSVHGLPPSEGQEPDVTTAADLALLCRALVSRPDALKYTGTRERGFRNDTFIMRNHNHLLEQVDGCDGLKTGFYQAAGFSIAATAKRGGNRVIAIVMGSKDRKVRDARAMDLLAKGFVQLPSKPEPVPAPAPAVATAPAGQEPPATVEAPVAEPAVRQEQTRPAAADAAGGWRMFFLGLAAGLALAGVPALLLLRRRKQQLRW